MSKNRSRQPNRKRTVDVREERKVLSIRELLTFSFKDFDQSQPKKSPETLKIWSDKGLLPKLFDRLMHLAKLTRSEAVNEGQIKEYGQFPDKDKTEFSIPSHVPFGANWAVITKLGGKIRVVGYVIENTFYIVFLDSEHRFYLSNLKHT
jgi:hypothetical protein